MSIFRKPIFLPFIQELINYGVRLHNWLKGINMSVCVGHSPCFSKSNPTSHFPQNHTRQTFSSFHHLLKERNSLRLHRHLPSFTNKHQPAAIRSHLRSQRRTLPPYLHWWTSRAQRLRVPPSLIRAHVRPVWLDSGHTRNQYWVHTCRVNLRGYVPPKRASAQCLGQGDNTDEIDQEKRV